MNLKLNLGGVVQIIVDIGVGYIKNLIFGSVFYHYWLHNFQQDLAVINWSKDVGKEQLSVEHLECIYYALEMKA